MSAGLVKAYKSLRFSELSRVMTIPSRHECLAPDMDLWWSHSDYNGFKQTRILEGSSGIDFASTQDKSKFVDLRVLLLSNESAISSPIMRNFAAALSEFEEELNRGEGSEGVCVRLRSSVCQVNHNSKEYALAVQGPAKSLHYNVIVYDNSRRTRPCQLQLERGSRQDSCVDASERDRKQATSYVDSSPNSYIVSPDLGSVSSDSINLSPLLLSDFDAAQVPSDENFLLCKIIKSGCALGFVCEEPSASLDCSSPYFAPELSPRRRRKSSSAPMCIPLPTDFVAAFPSSADDLPPAVAPSRHQHYSLLRDHADVVVGLHYTPLPSSSEGAPASLDDRAPPPMRPSPLTVSMSDGSEISSSSLRAVSVAHWLQLFRVTLARAAALAPSPLAAKKSPSPLILRRLSLGIVTSHELDASFSSPRLPGASDRSGESLLSRSLRGTSL